MAHDTFELIDSADRVSGTINARSVIDAVKFFFFAHDYIITSATADEATVVACGRKFIVKKTDKGGSFY